MNKKSLDRHITGNYGEDQFINENYNPHFFREEGVKARKNGVKLSDCPYEVGTIERNDWRYGWTNEDMIIGFEKEEVCANSLDKPNKDC